MTESQKMSVPDPQAEEEYALIIEGVKKFFYMGEEVVQALRGVDLAVKRGEYVSVMGPSGSGKTTMFNVVGGLEKPTEGQVYIDKTDISKLDATCKIIQSNQDT